MLAALRDFSLGDQILTRGDPISPELQATLPLGRIETLKAQRYVQEITAESVLSRALDDLEQRVAALEKRRGPGRPRKDGT